MIRFGKHAAFRVDVLIAFGVIAVDRNLLGSLLLAGGGLRGYRERRGGMNLQLFVSKRFLCRRSGSGLRVVMKDFQIGASFKGLRPDGYRRGRKVDVLQSRASKKRLVFNHACRRGQGNAFQRRAARKSIGADGGDFIRKPNVA